MKPFITFAIIAISLLLTTGCATPSSAPVQSPTTLEATETSDSEQDQDSSEIDESQSQSQEDDPEGWTPLMEAAAQDDLATVTRLIASKADLNAQTSQGWTALTVATIEMYTDIVEALISAGVDVNAQNGDLNVSALMIAANGGRIRRGLGFPSPSMEANTVVKMLLSAHADVNAANDDGATVLQYAVMTGDPEIIKTLLSAGADVNAADANGTTALMLASERLIPNMAEALLNAGADAKVKDHEGRTALDRFEQGKTRFFRFHYDRRDVFYKDGTIALTIINHEKLHDLLQAAMK